MSRIKLRRGDIALLERLNFRPLVIGDLPVDTVARLTALNLVRKVLGSCEITRQGQLTLHRQHFLKASGRRVARVTHHNPSFLSKARFGAPLSRAPLSEHLKKRRALDARVRQAARLPKWLARLATVTAGRLRTVDEAPSDLEGLARSKLKHEPRLGSK